MLHLNCTALSQSESSNFCLPIIIFVNSEYNSFENSFGFSKCSLFIVVYIASITHACLCKVIFAEMYSAELKEVFVSKQKEFQNLLYYLYPFQGYVNLQSFTDASYVNVDNAVEDKVRDEAIL